LARIHEKLLSQSQGQLQLLSLLAEILGLIDATPAPTISVPEETAALVAVPEVALNDKPPTRVGPANSCNKHSCSVDEDFSSRY
jgi:hypothetical protein